MLHGVADYRDFINNAPTKQVAKQLQADYAISSQQRGETSVLPSLTALYMPKWSSSRAQEVARCMWPEFAIYWKREVLQWNYDSMITSIRDQIRNSRHEMTAADGLTESSGWPTWER